MTITLHAATVALMLLSVGCQSAAIKVAEYPASRDLPATEQAQKAWKKATVDLERIQSNKDPIHGSLQTLRWDGGTRFFIGDGYRIVDHRELTMRDATHGRIVGQTVTFNSITTGGRPIEYSNAAFKPDSEQGGDAKRD